MPLVHQVIDLSPDDEADGVPDEEELTAKLVSVLQQIYELLVLGGLAFLFL